MTDDELKEQAQAVMEGLAGRGRLWRCRDHRGEYVVSEREILETYYPPWSKMMAETGRADLINVESCIADWTLIHWAWSEDVREVTD